MADKIKLVRGDNRPYITLTLTNTDGSTLDLTGATVVVYFRAAGTTALLSTLPCTVIGAATAGKVAFNFPGTTLNVPAGQYEGEVSIMFGTESQTIYDVLKFQIREQFA